MKELFMQIEIYEAKLNRTTCFDNIVNMKVLNNNLIIKDENDWLTNIKINEGIEVKVNFYNLDDDEFEI